MNAKTKKIFSLLLLPCAGMCFSVSEVAYGYPHYFDPGDDDDVTGPGDKADQSSTDSYGDLDSHRVENLLHDYAQALIPLAPTSWEQSRENYNQIASELAKLILNQGSQPLENPLSSEEVAEFKKLLANLLKEIPADLSDRFPYKDKNLGDQPGYQILSKVLELIL